MIITLLCTFQIASVSFATSVNQYGILSDSPYVVNRFMHDGKWIDQVIVPGRPPEIYRAQAAAVPEPKVAAGTNTLPNVPAFDWSYGCSATSAAMMFGYYDNMGYPNIYTGPTNGGVIPMTNAEWGYGECPLSATHQGIDGRTIRGHVDDYWVAYGSSSWDPYITGGWTEHTKGECTGDFMGTNQSSYENSDGSTSFYFYDDGSPLYDFKEYEPGDRDGCHGMRLFFESRGYTVSSNYSQYIMRYGGNTQGFTFEEYKQEIDAGRPVMIQVAGHSMLGYGYNDTGTLVYLRNTWNHSYDEMTWGGSYEGMQHYGVTVFVPSSVPPEIVTLDVVISGTGTGTITSAPSGIDCGSDCSEEFDYGTAVTLTVHADEDYIFTGWSGTCSGTDSECIITMAADSTVTATFEPQLSVNEGSIGTELTINGSGFGTKKGKILIGGIATKIARGDWATTKIICTIKKPPLPVDIASPVSVVVNNVSRPLEGTFTVRDPVLDNLLVSSGKYPDEITVKGKFFGTKKGKVYLEGPSGKKKTCRVTNWNMIPSTGESELRFLVPKPSRSFPAGSSYPLKVANKIGTATASTDFMIE
jgi:uncharacterized repeat protein (TIGR02543 family)